jgi:hypothetical protein
MRLWALRTRLASESSAAERTGWMWLAGLLVMTEAASSSPVASSATRSSVTSGLEVGSCSSELDCELNGKASGPALCRVWVPDRSVQASLCDGSRSSCVHAK